MGIKCIKYKNKDKYKESFICPTMGKFKLLRHNTIKMFCN